MSAKISDLAKSLLNYSGDVGRLRDGITSEYVFPHVEETRSILHLEELVLESNADKSDEDTENTSTRAVTINPENIRDYQGHFSALLKSSPAQSKPLVAAFSSPWGTYSIFRGAARSVSHQRSTEMLWRQVVLIIASHLDLGRPLTRILCLGGSASSEASCALPYSTGLLIEIEGFAEVDSQPVIFIRYRVVDEAVVSSLNSLPPHPHSESERSGPNSVKAESQITLFLSSDEITCGLTVLESDAKLLDSKYVLRWRLSDIPDIQQFSPSFLRPPPVPTAPMALAPMAVNSLDEQEQRISGAKRGLGKTESKEDIEKRTGQPVGKKRVPKTKEQLEERKALLSKARIDEHHRLCAWADCKAPGDQHCAGCKKVFYCTREHQRLDWNRYHGEECKGEAGSGGRILTPDLPAATAPFFDPMTSIYPSSVGLSSVVPEDIWDPGNTSICLDLKQHFTEKVPPSLHPEHEQFWIRILLPLLGKGPQSLVDQKITMRMSIVEKHSSYAAIKDCIKSKGYKGLKGFFPARRHGDFIRIYLDLINIDQNW